LNLVKFLKKLFFLSELIPFFQLWHSLRK
jgi:hypothetical protein